MAPAGARVAAAGLRFRATLLCFPILEMTDVQPHLQPSDSGNKRGPSRRAAPGGPLTTPVNDDPTAGSLSHPRVKMLVTQGDLTPAGATHTPPTPAPLPARGAGLHLVLSIVAAIVAVTFLVLLASKL